MPIHKRSILPLAVVWVLGLVALAAFHFVFVAREERAVADCRDRLEARTERFAFLRIARSDQQQQRRKAAEEELAITYAGFVFNTERMSQLDFELRNLAEKNNLQEFSARHVATTGKVGNTTLKKIAQRELIFSFKSTFPEFLRFVNELERHYPLALVDQFTLQTGIDGSGLLSCTLEGAVLYDATGQ